jgi:hypothetical protein
VVSELEVASCPPPVGSLDGHRRVLTRRGELRPFYGRGYGPLGSVLSDAITCLSHGVVDLAHGLFSDRRAALGGSHGLYRPAGQALMTL